MTHPENSTAQHPAQQAKLVPVSFGPEYQDVFAVLPGGSAVEALDIAADLVDRVSQLCSRLDMAINYGETAYCSEIRALRFLSDASAALVRSAKRGLQGVEE